MCIHYTYARREKENEKPVFDGTPVPQVCDPFHSSLCFTSPCSDFFHAFLCFVTAFFFVAAMRGTTLEGVCREVKCFTSLASFARLRLSKYN